MASLYSRGAKDAPTGEPETEFERGGDKGPFECGNCIHMRKVQGVCAHPVMVAKSKQPKKNGFPQVDKDDCCKFIRRPNGG